MIVMAVGGGVTANGYNVSFEGDENVLDLVVVLLVAQLCKYSKNK